MQFIDLQSQYQHLKENIDKRIHKVLDHGKYIMGPEVFELEQQLAKYVGVKHAITCGNGTDALQLSLMAMGIGPGDAVITTPFTFFATAEVIALVGATPVFSDIDEKTFNLCPKKLEESIQTYQPVNGHELKAVIAVDLFGLPACYPEIEPICKKYGLKLIEDAAQGMGGEINGKRAGSFGDMATTSFFPAKPLGCYGDGGAVFTDDDDLAEIVRSLRIHGKGENKYDNVRVGMNSRLDTIQAAVLLEKLAVFKLEVAARNETASMYHSRLTESFCTPYVPDGYLSSWAQYTLANYRRSDIMKALEENDVPTMVYYRTCLHQQTAFDGLSVNAFSYPAAEMLCQSVFSVPISPYQKIETTEYIISELLKLS
jgi:dTDP-4-amino-4,6-dideoxygalactose transaminase